MPGAQIPYPFGKSLPHTLAFRTMGPNEVRSYPTERPVGELVFSFGGVIELTVGNRQYLTPPHYGLWLPPQTERGARARSEACYCVLDIASARCSRGCLPRCVRWRQGPSSRRFWLTWWRVRWTIRVTMMTNG